MSKPTLEEGVVLAGVEMLLDLAGRPIGITASTYRRPTKEPPGTCYNCELKNGIRILRNKPGKWDYGCFRPGWRDILWSNVRMCGKRCYVEYFNVDTTKRTGP